MTGHNRNRAVLWDMDGVLVDTEEYHFVSWKETLGELGIPFNEVAFKQTFGMNNTGILERIYGRKLDADAIARISDRKESLFRELIRGKAELLAGVSHWLAQFQAWGLAQAVASSAPWENIEFLVAELDIATFFDALLSGFDLPGKPNPDIFLKAADALHVHPQNCIVIEDAIAGVEAAKRAGMKCVAVLTTNPASALEKADRIFDHLDKMKEGDFVSLFA